MARRPPGALFLERAAYRKRRLRDAARMLPVVGVVLVLLPLLWGNRGGTANAAALVYLFCVWAGLIVAAAVLARPLQRDDEGAD